jgi:hypothetical protein
MKVLLSLISLMLISFSSWSQIAIGINGGLATSSKINYATNKSAQVISGRVLYTTNHFEGGLVATYNMMNDAAYASVTNIEVVANGRIPLSKDIDNMGSYLTAGGGIGYGMADFGKGISLGLQLAYGYRLNQHFALVAEIAPRFYNFKINQDMYGNKWMGYANNTIDRFLMLPFTLGVHIKL